MNVTIYFYTNQAFYSFHSSLICNASMSWAFLKSMLKSKTTANKLVRRAGASVGVRRELWGSSNQMGRSLTDKVFVGVGVMFMTFSATFLAIPLYDMFCRSTGQGKADQSGHKSYSAPTEDPRVRNRTIRVEFDGTVQGRLRWAFYPEQKYVTVAPGETALAFFKAKNLSDEPTVGVSVYQMLPAEAGLYLNKIQCFCFDEQVLVPNEEVDMPIFFFIDPDIVDDPRFDGVDEITLSYIFAQSSSPVPTEFKEAFPEVQKPSDQSTVV
jgi:cytochrome c oxidase assembly protein subunit 11